MAGRVHYYIANRRPPTKLQCNTEKQDKEEGKKTELPFKFKGLTSYMPPQAFFVDVVCGARRKREFIRARNDDNISRTQKISGKSVKASHLY